jgi:hypothetical protein
VKKEQIAAINRLHTLYGQMGIIDVTKKDMKDHEGRKARHGELSPLLQKYALVLEEQLAVAEEKVAEKARNHELTPYLNPAASSGDFYLPTNRSLLAVSTIAAFFSAASLASAALRILPTPAKINPFLPPYSRKQRSTSAVTSAMVEPGCPALPFVLKPPSMQNLSPYLSRIHAISLVGCTELQTAAPVSI